MNGLQTEYNSIVKSLEKAGKQSPYPVDANEPDLRYKSYGVRAAAKKEIITKHRKAIRALSQAEQLELATKFMQSGYGEQQSIALFILEAFSDYFSPEKFEELDMLVRNIYDWSKVDSFTGALLRDVLFNHPDEFIKLVRMWNQDEDMWLRRISVVLFTRKVAKSGKFTDVALEMCDNLVFNAEELVLKGIGWSLKDLMKVDKKRILGYVQQLRENGVSSTVTLYAIKDIKGQERAALLNKT